MFFDNVKKLKEERDYYKQAYEELKAQLEAWDEELSKELNIIDCEIDESEIVTKERRIPTTFKDLHLPVGTALYYRWDSDKFVVVANETNTVRYLGEEMSINKASEKIAELTGNRSNLSAWETFCAIPNGNNLIKLRFKMEANGTYGE